MAGGTTEVSKKIRAAIKAKLEELGVYVDEELPDYIMVMIANKKEKSQMKEDLLLFLGKNSGKFVDWLFDIFERLQSAGASSVPQESGDNSKLKEVGSSSHRKESESSRKREKEEVVEKKKRRDGADRMRDADNKEHEKKEREKVRSTKEREKRENEKRSSTAKVVKSKPSHRTDKSPVLPPERTHHRRRSESPVRRAVSRTGTRRDDGGDRSERSERKVVQVKPRVDEKTERELREDARESRRRSDEKDRRIGRDLKPEVLNELAKDGMQQRKRKATSRSPPSLGRADRGHYIPDDDEEERLAEEESARALRSKKVQSSAVVKLPPEPTVKSVSSQVVVKRKLPEKETTKQSQGVKSLFLKAIKEAGETTRTASQIAGYGGGVVAKKDQGGKHKQDERTVDDEEGIEIDVYDDIGDTLVVMPDEAGHGGSGGGRSIVQTVDECNGSEPEVDKKRPRIHKPGSTDEPKFYITLKGDSISGLAKRLTKIGEGNVEIVKQKTKVKKRRNETNPILAHLNLSHPRQVTRETPDEKIVVENTENEGRVVSTVSEVTCDTKPLPAWDLQIQLPEEDTSDDDDGDDEARIDAVLASAQTGDQGFDEVPPTPTLSNPAFRPLTPPPQVYYNTPRQNVFALNKQPSNSSLASSVGIEKIMERCKFWPNCTLENCVYIHPNKPCNLFPNCTYGDRCIYIHPACKFDRSCLNPKCNFAHTLKPTPTTTTATTAQASASSTAPILSYNSHIPCKYGGKCANASCSFRHPKLCRFGDKCMNRSCYFWHPKSSAVAVLSAAGGKYKWKAPVTTSS